MDEGKLSRLDKNITDYYGQHAHQILPFLGKAVLVFQAANRYTIFFVAVALF